jgi:hypothetical protein
MDARTTRGPPQGGAKITGVQMDDCHSNSVKRLRHRQVMSALPPIADIGTRPRNVRFVPIAVQNYFGFSRLGWIISHLPAVRDLAVDRLVPRLTRRAVLGHCVELLPVVVSTTIEPTMWGCR